MLIAVSFSGGGAPQPASIPATIAAATEVPETSARVEPGDGALMRSPGARTSATRVLARASGPENVEIVDYH
ncbi:MAG TPA: hypothetical protein VLK57_00280 [Pseudonocardia sp.]|nr:hypothetical protein [Pseudonocardia sp.]